jgi:hypothetical protein
MQIRTTIVAVCCWMGVAGCGGGDEPSEERASTGIDFDGAKLSGCFASSDCKGGLVCYGATRTSMDATAGYCTDACQNDDPFAPGAICPELEKFAQTCSPDGQCRIDCTGSGAGDGKCPGSLECRDVDPREEETAFRCAYPVGTGRGNTKLWAECSPAHGDADCAAPNVCVAFGSGGAARGFCSAPCTANEECTAPGGATAVPICAPSLQACSLDCTGGASCPNGMQCIDTSPGQAVTERCRFVPPETTMEEPADMTPAEPEGEGGA